LKYEINEGENFIHKKQLLVCLKRHTGLFVFQYSNS